MTSDRATKANRRNAQASTGPRTSSGKQRASQNARSHGLSARHDAADDAEVVRLAETILGDHGSDPEIAGAALALAEAQVMLAHVLSIKARLIREEVEVEPISSCLDDQFATPPSATLLQRLEQLDRYERRAFSRRKSVARRFLNLASNGGASLCREGEGRLR
ncbi:hypothetical protein J2X36_004752 [Methylobacterium sp. BE186]|uniref:hypothetical protein n=1 Tax=Methylobacterium sp. BE186 TaxID=2817715 RepID=UPI0028652F9C|nr:hypothetical protein [Methylobacterium sp. BE186]MDR7039974.1 hypothetical protein [Methylobacterium sp. BE186]